MCNISELTLCFTEEHFLRYYLHKEALKEPERKKEKIGILMNRNEEPDIERFARYKNTLLGIIHKYIPGCKVYLFGSRARGTHSQGADIDLAVDAGVKVDYKNILKIYSDLEETTIPLFVDVVDFNNTSEEMREEIRKEGIEWVE